MDAVNIILITVIILIIGAIAYFIIRKKTDTKSKKKMEIQKKNVIKEVIEERKKEIEIKETGKEPEVEEELTDENCLVLKYDSISNDFEIPTDEERIRRKEVSVKSDKFMKRECTRCKIKRRTKIKDDPYICDFCKKEMLAEEQVKKNGDAYA